MAYKVCLISVIIPVYQVEPYVARCIESILVQTLQDLEIILVDDGSTDESGRICDQYKVRDSRIKVIHQTNGGISAARNTGLDVAKGRYIGFIDSDDYIAPNMYELMYEAMHKKQVDLAVCNYEKVYEGDIRQEERVEEKLQEQLIYTRKAALQAMQENRGCWTYVNNKLYKREIFKALRFEEGRIYEDAFIMPKLMSKCEKIVTVPESLYFYVQRAGSILHTQFNEKRLDKVTAFQQEAALFRAQNEYQLSRRAERDYINTLLWSYYILRKDQPKESEVLRAYRKNFMKDYKYICKNPMISRHEKVSLGIWGISPYLYEKWIRGSR